MNKAQVQEQIKNFKKFIDIASELFGQSINGYNEALSILEESEYIFELSKFKENQIVKLNKTPIIDEKNSWGWIGFKHFLIEGATGVIKDIRIHKGKFQYGIQFDNDSYLDYISKKEILTDKKGTFYFSESYLSEV